MRLLDSFLRGIKKSKKNILKYADSSTITVDERPFYKSDDYYTLESHPGTVMAQQVITFNERKKTTFPSSNGLYVAEILLLDYCNKGDYPKPKNGYPGFWWFTYGIRDIGNILTSLEKRGFIEWASKLDSLKNLNVKELKEIANMHNIKTNQKKEELIKDIRDKVCETELPEKYFSKKYRLTELGKSELIENEYIPYMHKHKFKTSENVPKDLSFTIWDMNRILAKEDKSRWREIIGTIEKGKYGVDLASENNTINKVEFRANNNYDIQGYKASGIKMYQLLVAMDDKTCEKCKKLNGKIFKVSGAKVGINVPPFHTGCRCTTIAYFEDD